MQVVEGTAKLHGCTADVKWSEQAYIPTVNDAKMVSVVEEAARKLVGVDRWQRLAEPTMAGEDFGFLAGRAVTQVAPLGCLTEECLHTFSSPVQSQGVARPQRKLMQLKGS